MPEQALSEQEQRVADLVAQGKPNLEIAVELGVSIAKVKRRLQSVARKWGCRNRTEVAIEALKRREDICPTCGQPLPS